MQATTLDSLVSEEESQQQRHDLGRGAGINDNASITTGKIVTLSCKAQYEDCADACSIDGVAK